MTLFSLSPTLHASTVTGCQSSSSPPAVQQQHSPPTVTQTFHQATKSHLVFWDVCDCVCVCSARVGGGLIIISCWDNVRENQGRERSEGCGVEEGGKENLKIFGSFSCLRASGRTRAEQSNNHRPCTINGTASYEMHDRSQSGGFWFCTLTDAKMKLLLTGFYYLNKKCTQDFVVHH